MTENDWGVRVKSELLSSTSNLLIIIYRNTLLHFGLVTAELKKSQIVLCPHRLTSFSPFASMAEKDATARLRRAVKGFSFLKILLWAR